MEKKYRAMIWISLCIVLLAVISGGVTFLRGAEFPPLPPPVPQANPYEPADFKLEGEFMTCLAAESVIGIDVSAHQGEIDWQLVKEAGIEFVMIRVGYRGYETGKLNEDAYARQNYEGAKAAGLKVGAYFFSQALSPLEAINEALFLVDRTRDWQLDMPLVYDWERMGEDTRTPTISPDNLTACAEAFCRVVESSGREAMVYFNPHHAKNYFHLEQLTEYPFWLALYADQMDYEYKVEMWQYTNEGSVPGIRGDVDMNLLFIEENP